MTPHYRYGEERYERRDLQLRVRQRFHQLRDMDMANTNDDATTTAVRIPWVTVSAAQSMDQVEAEIYAAVQETLAQVQAGKPLGKMWQEGHYELS